MEFRDRRHAAERLVQALRGLEHPLVLGIPRGGVVLGRILADKLHGDLDVALVRKIGAPGNPEVAIGAIDETGVVTLRPGTEHWLDPQFLAGEVQRQRDLIAARRALYTPVREPLDPAGRTVVVVDDGAATGETMLAALRAVRRHDPSKVIVALPIASSEALERFRGTADSVTCLAAPEDFKAVGAHYRHFDPVTDDEVVTLLGAR